MAHALIAGCGYLGTALGVRLVAGGHVVWGLRRDLQKLPTSIKGVEGDLAIPNTLRNLPRVDWLFYLAPPEPSWIRYLAAAVAASRQRLRRLVVVSSVDVYGDRGGAWVDEDSEVRPDNPRGRACAEVEAVVSEAPWPVTVVRLGEVYGPSRLGMLANVLSGEPVPVRGPRAHASTVHRDDAIGAFSTIVKAKKAERLYVATDRTPAPAIEVLEWLATRAGRKMPAITPAADAPPDVRAMSDRLLEEGWELRYPSFREGYAPLLARLGR